MTASKLNEKGGSNPVFPIAASGEPMQLLKFLLMLSETEPIITSIEYWAAHLDTVSWN